jgi:hypothetical protein
MRIEKNGVMAIEFTPIHKKTGEFLQMEPYQIHDSDKWKCPSCGMEILAGFGQQPWAVEGMSWIETPAPGERIKITFRDMLRRVVASPQQTYVSYTDFSQEDQDLITKMLSNERIMVILNVEDNKDEGEKTC